MKRILGRATLGLMGALALLYMSDWAVWRVRLAVGGGMGQVSVNTIVVLSLKNNKEEYDWGGTAAVACSHSIFPQAGGGACWWLRHHNVIYQR